ncbi:MAG: TldD/PmbA family protein [Bacteroidota bacterium]|nr:TldD/PmbA family protein [Bacteroidota bacterium]MDP4190999.1 TldD/PmbA family protein [Bacteroidota bacterium]MDP4194589.1 TldD/PmbA family protein [Bacteroidota bacterium]
MLLDEHKQLANKIVDLSKKSGADTAVVRIDYNKNNQISVREQKIESLEQAGSKSLSLTLSKDKKRVSVSSNDFSESAIKNLIKDAMAMVKYMGADEFYNLPDESELGKASEELLLFDPKESDFPMERRIEMAKALESNALKENKDLISDGASVGSNSGHTVLANSKGFCDGYQYTDCFIDMNCAVPDSTDGLNSARKQSGGWYSVGRSFEKLDSVENVAKIAAKRTLDKRGARKPKTQVVPVIFENNVSRALLSFLVNAISGSNIYTKQSFLTDKLGHKIAGENITIIEDPLIPGQLGSRPFDADGVKSKKKVVVEKGVLKTFLLDTYSANKLRSKTTGNAGGVSNFYLTPGSYSLEELIKSVDNGVLITSLSGFGEILQTGDYSRGAQGFWIEHGKIAYAVNEFTIASNMYKILENVEMIGNDPLITGSIYCPSLKIKEMTVSGV